MIEIPTHAPASWLATHGHHSQVMTRCPPHPPEGDRVLIILLTFSENCLVQNVALRSKAFIINAIEMHIYSSKFGMVYPDQVEWVT